MADKSKGGKQGSDGKSGPRGDDTKPNLNSTRKVDNVSRSVPPPRKPRGDDHDAD